MSSVVQSADILSELNGECNPSKHFTKQLKDEIGRRRKATVAFTASTESDGLGLLGCMLRRLLSHRGLTAAAGAAAAAWALPSACEQRSATGAQAAAAAAADALPIYSKAEVAKHTTPESGIWVVFRGDVYDITTFVQNQRLSKPSPMGHGRPEPPDERLVGRGWPERGAA